MVFFKIYISALMRWFSGRTHKEVYPKSVVETLNESGNADTVSASTSGHLFFVFLNVINWGHFIVLGA